MTRMESTFDANGYTTQAKQSWTSVAEGYDRISARLFAPLRAGFLSFIQLKPGQLVLDVACGTGQLTTAAAAAIGPSGRVVGVDLSPGMLKIAMGRAVDRNLEYREMDAASLDFPDDTFDAVISHLGLMLFAQPEVALREMARVCKKGGVVAVLVQGEPERMAYTSLVMKSLFRLAPELKQSGAPSLYAFAPSGALEQALGRAGLAQPLSSRAAGTFRFSSPHDYWGTFVQGAGRTGSLLASLPEDVREAVRKDVMDQADLYCVEGRLEIPYEVVMAKAVKR
jgi:ubiquinone/menaquinone biosynthesis C-methylase UbiE